MRQLTYRQYYHMTPSEFQDGDHISVKLVCVLGYGNDYAIYMGTTDMSDEEIAQSGDKVYTYDGEKVGPALFRTATEQRFYRR